MIILVSNQKGGVGKTTIAVHLATWLAEQDVAVTALDADNQALFSTWCEMADDRVQRLASTNPDEIADELQRCRAERRVCIADGAPGMGPATRTLVRNADAILVPTRANSVDYRSSMQFIDLVSRPEMQCADELVVRVAFNLYETSTRNHRERRASIIKACQAEVLQHTLSKRTAIERAAEEGTVVWRMDPKDKGARAAAQELDDLFNEFFQEINDARSCKQAAA